MKTIPFLSPKVASRLASAIGLTLFFAMTQPPAAYGETVLIRAIPLEKDGVIGVEYRSADTLVGRSTEAAPAGVELLLPDGQGVQTAPVRFHAKTEKDGVIELGPEKIGSLTLRWRLTQKTPSLVERTMEVSADAAQRFSFAFPLDSALEGGEYASFSGQEKERMLYNILGGGPYHADIKGQTFPLAMLRTSDRVFGLIADSPGLWENRCYILIDPGAKRLALFTGRRTRPLSAGRAEPELHAGRVAVASGGRNLALHDLDFRQSGADAL